jgi:circadian clock protein KaiB
MSQKTDTETEPVQNSTEAFELALSESGQGHYVLRLYVAGMTPNLQRAIENVQ